MRAGWWLWSLAALSCRSPHPGPTDWRALAAPEIVPPLPKPSLYLRDTEGQLFDLERDTAGRLTLLLFGYTHCPDVCPVQLANISSAVASLPAAAQDRLKVVFVSVDPVRDSAAVLRRYLDHFDHRFIGLRGDSASIAWVFGQLRLEHAMDAPVAVDSASYTVAHNAAVFVFTPDNLAHVAYPTGIARSAWAHDLGRLLQD